MGRAWPWHTTGAGRDMLVRSSLPASPPHLHAPGHATGPTTVPHPRRKELGPHHHSTVSRRVRVRAGTCLRSTPRLPGDAHSPGESCRSTHHAHATRKPWCFAQAPPPVCFAPGCALVNCMLTHTKRRLPKLLHIQQHRTSPYGLSRPQVGCMACLHYCAKGQGPTAAHIENAQCSIVYADTARRAPTSTPRASALASR